MIGVETVSMPQLVFDDLRISQQWAPDFYADLLELTPQKIYAFADGLLGF